MLPDEEPTTRNLVRTSGGAAFERVHRCTKAGTHFSAICFCATGQARDDVHTDEH